MAIINKPNRLLSCLLNGVFFLIASKVFATYDQAYLMQVLDSWGGTPVTPKADLNEDRVVDWRDLFLLSARWHSPEPSPTPFYLRIIYTGADYAYHHSSNISGGIRERATVINSLVKSATGEVLVIDVGKSLHRRADVSDDQLNELHRIAASAFWHSLKSIGYEWLNLGEEDLRFSTGFIEEATNFAPSFISTNISYAQGKEPWVRLACLSKGKLKIGLIGLIDDRLNGAIYGDQLVISSAIGMALNAQQFLEQQGCKLIITLYAVTDIGMVKSLLDSVGRINIIIVPLDQKLLEKYLNAYILYIPGYGQYVGVCDVTWQNNGIQKLNARWQRIGANVTPSQEIDTLLNGYYAQIEANPTYYPPPYRPFANPTKYPEEYHSDAGYVGPQVCRSCHQSQYDKWINTAHYFSTREHLRRKNKDYYPECVTCHSTGYVIKGGYRLAKGQTSLETVSCETCHGPGKRHYSVGGFIFIRRETINEGVCLECHVPEHSPNFHYETYRELIKHWD